MAPVDPTDLLKAFKPLLTVLGGIKSMSDVPRLSLLMKKYSRKLVSRCIYCNILLSTSPDILQSFLERDGWNLINAWLKDSLNGDNYQFICELLDLLDKCPMTVERLKTNDTAKLVKSLSKNTDNFVANKAKSVVDKWTGLIKPNENVNNGNLARKKRKKDKSGDDEDSDTAKTRKVKSVGGVLQQQVSVNDATVNNNSCADSTSTKATSTSAPKTTGEAASQENEGNGNKLENRPRTAKVKFGKSRGLAILEDCNASSTKSKGTIKKGADSTTGKSGTGNKNNKLNSKSTDKSTDSSVPVSSSGLTVAHLPKPKPTLKDSVGFIEDIVSLSSINNQVRKRRKSDSKSKSATTSGSNTAKDSGPTVNSNNGEESNKGHEPMDTNQNSSDEARDDRVVSPSEDDSNSNTSSNNNGNNLPIVDVPELDNLVIPEIEPSKLTGVIKSILGYSRLGKTKKTVKWRAEDKLKEIKFFELDETERTNVSKVNFGDHRSIDMKNERQMLQQLRNKSAVPSTSGYVPPIPNPIEKCVTYQPWRLVLIDLPPGLPLIEAGSQSEERRIQADLTKNASNSDFFPAKEVSQEFLQPKEPDLEPSVGNDGPREIPLEDENFTVTDYSALPPPQPRTGESYPGNRGLPTAAVSPVYPASAIPPRPPTAPIPRPPFPPGGFVPPVAPGYPPYVPPGGPRMIPPRPPVPPGAVIPPPGFQPSVAGWARMPRNPPICRNFLKSGNCRFMARCNYLHQYPSNNSHGPPGPS